MYEGHHLLVRRAKGKRDIDANASNQEHEYENMGNMRQAVNEKYEGLRR